MRIFTKSTAVATTNAATKAAKETAKKVEMCKNVLAIYGGVRLMSDIWNAVKVARLIKAGKIAQGEDGYWYYTSDQDEQEGGDEEEAQ